MPDDVSLPFHSFTFTLVEERRPRTAFRMRAGDGGLYELHVEKGSAANPTMQFTRSVPVDVAQRLKDSLQDIGVFNWEESYKAAAGGRSCRWSVNTVFKEGVFAVSSRGDSEKPQGFDALLEELYRLDFPRPASGQSETPDANARGKGLGSAMNAFGLGGMGSIGGMSTGDLGAYSAAGKFGNAQGLDPAALGDLFGQDGVPGIDGAEMAKLMEDMQRNPQALQQRMRDEFKHLSPEEQERMLDMLSSSGMASREWWRRYLNGE